MTTRKFFKTTITFEVLTQEPIPDGMLLESIIANTIHGDYVGKQPTFETKELNGEQTVEELMESGSEPDFFQLDFDGDDTN